MKLKNLLNESQHLSYKRMNIGEEENEKGMTNEEKKAFLEAVSSYRQLGEMISHKGDLQEIHENIKKIVESASSLTLKETGDWFDKVTVNRHMKSMNESYKIFSNSIKEVVTLQQRMESAYDEIGEVLGKYYEIKEGNEFGAERAKAIAKGEDEFEVGGKTFKVTNVDDEDKENAEKFANESIKEDKSMKLKNLLNESFGFGDLPSSKLIKMKQTLAETMADEGDIEINENKYSIIDPKGNQKGVGPKDAANKMQKKLGGSKKGYFVVPAKFALKARRAMEKYKFDFKNPKLQDMMSDLYFEGVEESVNEARVSAKKLLQSIVDGQTSRIEGIKMSKEMAQSFLDWQRTSPFGKKYGGLPFNRLFTAAFNWGLHRHADKKSKEYKELEAKAKQMANDRRSESVNEEIAVGKMVKVVDNPHWEAALGKKGPFKRKVKGIHGDSVFFTDGSNSDMKYVKESVESVNEGASTEEKRIVMMAIKKIAKLRNVPIDQSVVDVVRAAEELDRDIQKGKVK